jgi:hypothetical protein
MTDSFVLAIKVPAWFDCGHVLQTSSRKGDQIIFAKPSISKDGDEAIT